MAGGLLDPVAAVFYVVGFVWMRVLQPACCVLLDGWSNLVFIIMFVAMLVWSLVAGV